MSLPLLGAAMLGLGAATGVGPGSAVDPSTLRGKVLFGYQGWFDNPNSGSQGEGAEPVHPLPRLRPAVPRAGPGRVLNAPNGPSHHPPPRSPSRHRFPLALTP